MKVIGITGGIGSGKSTVTGILEELGAKVIDADIISRDIIYNGSKAYNEIIAFFGSTIINDNGDLDRKRLGEIVFSDIDKLKKLKEITHKYIIGEITEKIELEKISGNSDTIILEASLPVEHGFMDLVNEIWVVISNLEDRIERVMKRNGYSVNEVLERINSQLSEEEYIKIADKVIINSGTFDILKRDVINLFKGDNP